MDTMKALVKTGPAAGLAVRDVPMPPVGPEDVLIKVLASSICGTDLHIYNWDAWSQSQMKPPVVVGHEFTGEIVETGKSVRNLKAGDRVSVESHVPCGRCHQCTHGLQHICDKLQIIGVHRDGSWAQYVSIPALCAWKQTTPLPPEVGTLMEPMGNAVHAVSAAKVKGKSVAVFGCGPVGLFAIAVAKALEASTIYAIDVNPARMELARKMGAHELLNGADPDLVATLRKRGGGSGLDVSLEMSGHAGAISNALDSLRKGGTCVAFGLPSRPIQLDWANQVIMNGRTVLGIVGRLMFETWEEMQRLMDSGRLDPRPIVTHQFPMADFEKAFATIQAKDSTAGKVVLRPW